MPGFLEKLRSADEGRKMRWAIASAIVIMALVIYVWLAYFNTLFARFDDSSSIAAEENSAPREDQSRLSSSITQRMGSLYHAFTGALGAVGNALKLRREYIVKPQ